MIKFFTFAVLTALAATQLLQAGEAELTQHYARTAALTADI